MVPWHFPEVTIYGRVPQRSKPPPPPQEKEEPVPPKITATAIHFTGVNEGEIPPSTDFADALYVVEIQHVVDILWKDPKLHVTLEASVGITEGPALRGWNWADEKLFGNKPPPRHLGRTKEAYADYGYVMDARARRVREELLIRGVSADRIHMSRGEVQMGAAGRKVEFTFERR